MNLDSAQQQTVKRWIDQGLKLSDIQKKLADELGVNLTYMEVRFLIDDLKLKPKDAEPPKAAVPTGMAAAPAPGSRPSATAAGGPGAPAAGAGGVSLTVDEVARPGALVSGKATFSDGNTAEWHLDQMGRLGVVPTQQGYRPSQADLMAFQTRLQDELAKLGY